ncbi:uncharacterized protein LOC135496785 [Lineus longissimus]|uniref:uncharacterized protein LOC135496785 n=1 Tax=Lineus longissimus TaxID=88925 RepID=UPI002B4F265A
MLLYVESKAFPYKTFVVLVKVEDTIAKIRAHLLHILYQFGRADHQFRLRFKGQYLRDGYTIEDYSIPDDAIIKMVPMSRRSDSHIDLRSLSSRSSLDLGEGQSPEVKAALDKEINIFTVREHLVQNFHTMSFLHLTMAFLSVFSTFFYAIIWLLVIWFAGLFCPQYTRISGFTGTKSLYKFWFCPIYGILSLGAAGVSIWLAVIDWSNVAAGCPTSYSGCSVTTYYSGIFFIIDALILLTSSSLSWGMLINFQTDVGDIVEKFLVQSRDIEKVLQAARHGKLKEKRVAAIELATLAASGDDNKFRIVAEGGLEVLINMALCQDEATQENAVETIAELLTVPAIQDRFVEIGGMKTLSAVLNSPIERLVYEAASAISYVVSESDENKQVVVQGHGLEDICRAVKTSNLATQRVLASILLELAFNVEIRSMMASMNSPAQALIHLCHDNDPETQRYALQTLELLAIESADMICAQDGLMEEMLALPQTCMDEKLYLLAGKVLLYYAENKETCGSLITQDNLRSTLCLFAKTKDPLLQKVVIKIIFCIVESKTYRYKAQELSLDEVLVYCRDHSADRETWDMADQALQLISSDEDSIGPDLALTIDKLNQFNKNSSDGSDSGTSMRKPVPSTSQESDEAIGK